ncbi:hypothetical protein GO755_34910 [Spirosoma sp. HMF4905]|uniref:Uncharacterized protein n=1 Tax=Spirosoma arboris TaxID=2682092 RepID=A0A7K1SN93_9BACT|nr:hypothetical protein [Spirosoma arboris]MVM35265.1 hypothetical protein [Spirosoma arboris]
MIPSTAPATADANGNFQESGITWTIASPCRDEANSGGNRVQLTDSSTVVYESLIQLPKSCPDIAVNTPIRVMAMDQSTIRVKGEVKRFSRDQLHCRIWI